MTNIIAIASDHAGYNYKEKVKVFLTAMEIKFIDYGAHSSESSDYPDFGHAACEGIMRGECDKGIFVCGSGIGISIVANKHKGIRASACESVLAAELSRKHNNTNVLCFGERLVTWETAEQLIKAFLSTEFEGGRHIQRVNKIHSLTSC